MTGRLITDAQADEWRYDLTGNGHRYRFEPVTGLFMPRARMTVLEDGGEPVIVSSFAADVIEECGDYLRRLADYLKGTK